MPLLPRPYPDEVIGSVIARACFHAGVPLKRLISGMHGAQRSTMSFLMSSDVQTMGVLSGIDAEELLLNHTVFPYTVAFMPEATRAALRCKALAPASGEDCLSSITKNVSHGAPFRRVCPACISQDMARYGESYWRRSHLLPGVLTCAAHGIALQNTAVRLRGATQTTNINLPHELEARTHQMPGSMRPVGVYLAVTRASVALLEGEGLINGSAYAYRQQALELGYRLPSGDVAGARMSSGVLEHYGAAFLTDAGCAVETIQRNPWPSLMVREGTQVPFTTAKHVLLRSFLGAPSVASDQVRMQYRQPGKRTRDYGRMDARAEAKARTALRRAQVRNERVTVKALLCDAGVWAPFRHQRERFPKLSALLQEFRFSNQAERQTGGRPCWRERQPQRFGQAAPTAMVQDTESCASSDHLP